MLPDKNIELKSKLKKGHKTIKMSSKINFRLFGRRGV